MCSVLLCNSNNHESIIHSNDITCPLCTVIEENEELKKELEQLQKPRIKL